MSAAEARAWVYTNLVPRQHSLEEIARMSDDDVIQLWLDSGPDAGQDTCADCFRSLSKEHCEECGECSCENNECQEDGE